MTIQSLKDHCDVVGEYAELTYESLGIIYSIETLYYRKLALAQEIMAKYDEGIKWSAAGVKAIESGRADVEDARRMIRETLALEEWALAKCREMVSMDDEVIALRKRSFEIADRLLFLCNEIIDYIPFMLEESKEDVVRYSELLKEHKAKCIEAKAELKEAKRSGDARRIQHCEKELEYQCELVNSYKDGIKVSERSVKSHSASVKNSNADRERLLAQRKRAEEKIAEAEKEKRMDELRMAEPAARIEELKAKWDFL